MPLSRRELIKLSAGVAAAGAGAAAFTNGLLSAEKAEKSAQSSRRKNAQTNVIFMVADGMSLGVPTLAEPFSHLVRAGRGTHWHELLEDAKFSHGLQDTASLNSLVTDSAAASSAWGSGSRVFNGSINVLPDGTKLTPIAALAQSAGRRVGLVTTTTITHATPAGFATVTPHRDDEDKIAPQYLNVVDVLMGGGAEFFSPALRSQYQQAGYAFWPSRDEVAASSQPAKVLGLFSKSHLPYTIDRDASADLQKQVPTLAEMTQAALAILDSSPRGFLLQVEGGRVDHAAHNNDAAGALWDQLAFDDAIGVVLEYAKHRPDTLVVITSDHGNSNPGLNGMGARYEQSTKCLERLVGINASFPTILNRIKPPEKKDAAVSVAQVLGEVHRATQIQIAEPEAEVLAAVLSKRSVTALNRQHAGAVGVLGDILSNYIGIGWTGTTHTADFVLVTALGPGQDAFRVLRRNTEMYEIITGLMGLAHKNPSLSPQAARQFAAVPVAERPHWV